MKVETYSHHHGETMVDPLIKQQVIDSLRSINYQIKKYCADDLRNVILADLRTHGWSDEITLDVHSKISLTSSLHDHALCLQTGNMGRFYADLLKLQYVFANKRAKAAFYILPSKNAARSMGDNIANFDRFKKELDLFKTIITIPTLVLGIN